MANEERKILVTGRDYVLMAEEATLANDPGTDATDYVDLDSFETEYVRGVAETENRSPYGNDAFDDTLTSAHMSFKGSTKLRMQTITAADGSDDPHFDKPFRLAGMARERDAVNNAITYIPNVNINPSLWMDAIFPTRDATAGAHYQHAGSRAGWTLELPTGSAPLMFNFEGKALVLEADDPTSGDYPLQNYASAPHAFSVPTERPLIGKASNFRISDGTNIYGGGTLATPVPELRLLSASISSGITAEGLDGHGAGAGIARVDLGMATELLTLVIEATNPALAAGFNPEKARDERTPWFFDYRCSVPGTTGNVFQYFTQGKIRSVSPPSPDDKVMIYTVVLKLLAPKDLGAGGGAATIGTKPSQTFTENAGGTLGPMFVPAAGFTQVGTQLFQVATI